LIEQPTVWSSRPNRLARQERLDSVAGILRLDLLVSLAVIHLAGETQLRSLSKTKTCGVETAVRLGASCLSPSQRYGKLKPLSPARIFMSSRDPRSV
jgi:hypothetical protein